MPSITITLDSTNAARVASAFGRYWNLRNQDGTPRDATLPEIKEFVVRQLRGVVRRQEAAEDEAAFAAAQTDLAAT